MSYLRGAVPTFIYYLFILFYYLWLLRSAVVVVLCSYFGSFKATFGWHWFAFSFSLIIIIFFYFLIGFANGEIYVTCNLTSIVSLLQLLFC